MAYYLKPNTQHTIARLLRQSAEGEGVKANRLLKLLKGTKNPRRQSNKFVLLLYPDNLSMPLMQETASDSCPQKLNDDAPKPCYFVDTTGIRLPPLPRPLHDT